MRRVATIACALAAAALTPASAAGAGVQISATPALKPAFRTSVVDYVSRCGSGKPLKLSVDAPAGDTVSVDGRAPQTGTFTSTVALKGGQATKLVVRVGSRKTTHYVRCLPSPFPHWSFDRPGKPGAQWYLFAPSSGDGKGPYINDVIIMDGNGVPVWWRRAEPAPFNSLLLPNGQLAWTRWYADPFGMRPSSAWEIHGLDGKLVRTLKTVGSPADTHEMEPLPNGDFLLTTYRLRKNVDLAPYGASGRGGVFDGEIQEISPTGAVVWLWNSHDHVAPSETTTHPLIERTLPDGETGFDVFHLNSVAPDGHGGLVISARHTDALYRIDMTSATGITWKLGGTHTGQSLDVKNDPLSPSPPLAMQHDARVLPDGTVTVYDNRSHVGAPRAVRYAIDTTKHTATWLGQVTEPNVRSSGAEGSARRLAGGNWVVSWGGSQYMSEFTASNRLVWRLKFDHNVINYRLTPIPSGRISAASLRAAMDAMNPRH